MRIKHNEERDSFGQHPARSNGARNGLEPIAIIGIGCRFPQAVGPDAFWKILSEGVDATTDFPSWRFDMDAFYDPRLGTPGRIVQRRGGYVDKVDQFDPYFFGISPREVERMDPQQRLLLLTAWEALEDAGQVPGELAGRLVSTFIGACSNDYEAIQIYRAEGKTIDIYAASGSARSILAGRVSYALGLQGPSLSIDAACSSSLVAVHLGCHSIWSGGCSMALAGGANLVLIPEVSMGFSSARMLAPDGRCKFGDAGGDGFVRSDGVGVVVLKSLSAAQADGDPIYAVILGTAVNNDGNSGGLLMTPSQVGQEQVLREAYRNAGISPAAVQYIEAHGTGTSVGDPIELGALGAVLSEYRTTDEPCHVGSVKTNFGHTEGAAGIAGLIKVALSLKHKAIPPSLHFNVPNPSIPWSELPVVVQKELQPWPVQDGPATAGVSAFGICGTNAHAILQELPAEQFSAEYEEETHKPELLTLSAHTARALEEMAQKYISLLNSTADSGPGYLRDLCYTASVRRTHHDHRLALVAHSPEQIVNDLESYLRGEVSAGTASGIREPASNRKLVFVFPGQGSQWFGMARQLLRSEQVFREAIARCDSIFREHVEWSLLEQLNADEEHSRLTEIDVIQPTLFAIEYALAQQWRSWGITPDAVVGQSMGEIAACVVAGAISLEDGAKIICRRSRLLKRVSGQGVMAVVDLSLEQAQQALDGYGHQVSIAVSNSPTSTVLSGDPASMEKILDRLERRNIFCRLVKVDIASHSPQMEPLRGELLQLLEGVESRPHSTPIYSTVNGREDAATEFGPEYWVRNLREPVLFAGAIQQLLQGGHNIFIEMSPHPILLGAIQQTLRHLGQEGAVLPSFRRDENECEVMLSSLGALYSLGHPIDWKKIHEKRRRVVKLPSYPWQLERYWREDYDPNVNARRKGRFSHRKNGFSHSLLDAGFKSAVHAGTHHWEIDINLEALPYLTDHRVQGVAVLPAASYLEMALAASEQIFGPGPHILEKVNFKKALFVPEEGSQLVQLIVSHQIPGKAGFQFFTHDPNAIAEERTWTLHVAGTIRANHDESIKPHIEKLPLDDIRARLLLNSTSDEHYASMLGRGLEYGPTFQGVRQIWHDSGEALAQIQVPGTLFIKPGDLKIHPALLDASLQVVASALAKDDSADSDTFLPVAVTRMILQDKPSGSFWAYARLRSNTNSQGEEPEGDIYILNELGNVIGEISGLKIQKLEVNTDSAEKRDSNDWLYQFQWEERQHTEKAQSHENNRTWLIFADGSGAADALKQIITDRGEPSLVVTAGASYEKLSESHYQVNPESTDDFAKLLGDTFGSGSSDCAGIVHLWSLDAEPIEDAGLESFEASNTLSSISVTHLVQAISQTEFSAPPRLWLVTAGAQTIDGVSAVAIEQAPLWGLGRVISHEHPKLRCTRVDLSRNWKSQEIESLYAELTTDDREDQLAFRDATRFVARLNKFAVDPTSPQPERFYLNTEHPEIQPQMSFRLDAPTPGILDNLAWRVIPRKALSQGEVEIQVFSVGLNFRDVMLTLGLLPPVLGDVVDLGWECSGRISRIGEGVEGFAVGDEVIAVAPPCFGAFATTVTSLVVPKPKHLSFAEAATIPIAFITAHYALNYLGRMRKGESVLIHAAAGGVGLAAVQLAQRAGVEIYATAGSPAKREYLQGLGIKHVMDSRSLDFADEIIQLTGGRGVDLVLNSLAGEFIPKNLSVLAPRGRLLEIGKTDILKNSLVGLGHFQNNLSLFGIDLSQLFLKTPEFCGDRLREVMEFFDEGSITALPVTSFPSPNILEGFRHMAQAKNIGKIVVSFENQEVMAVPDPYVIFNPDASYLMTGGLGGLGLTIAKWMAQRGARHLVLVGRSAPSKAAQEVIDELNRSGVEVVTARADVAHADQVAMVLAGISQSMPPLKGIIHAAAVLDDGIILQMNRQRFQKVMAPKVSGAWNLHTLTKEMPLDFFVLFSSAASLLGSPGQGNYSAANSFLDALAHHRRTLGLPALSINWGPWSEVGLAARPDRGGRLAHRGVGSIAPHQGLEILGRAMRQDVAQIGAMPFSIHEWRKFYPGSEELPLFSYLVDEAVADPTSATGQEQPGTITRGLIFSTNDGERAAVVESYLCEKVAKVLGLSASKLNVQQPLNRLGLDSLMAVEVKNRIECDLGVTLSLMRLLKGANVSQLAAEIVEQLGAAESPHESIDEVLQVVEEPANTEYEVVTI
jgi:acyl transferase domain-containing protein/acyl carrier protein